MPKHLRDAHYQGAEQLGHGTDYEYSHDRPDAWSDQDYLPEAKQYYEPVERGHEAVIRQRLEELQRRKQRIAGEQATGDSQKKEGP